MPIEREVDPQPEGEFGCKSKEMEIPAGEGEVAPPPGPCPWLVFHHGQTQTFCCNTTGPSSSVKMYHKRIPDLQNKEVVCCSHGMLVLYDVVTKLVYLCSSTTFGDTVVLPSLHHLSNYKIDSCVLIPNWSDSLMVVIFLESFQSIMCCRVGLEHGWTEIAYREQLNARSLHSRGIIERLEPEHPLYFSGAAICGNKIIATHRSKLCDFFCFTWCLEIVEEEEEGLRLLFSPTNMRDEAIRNMYAPIYAYFLESCGEIFCLYFLTKALAFEVYTMDFDSMCWKRVKNVKDRAFFVGERYCVSCPLSGPGRIYFTYGNPKSFYCFYIYDESIVVSLLPCSVLSSPAWVMPQDLVRPEDDHCNGGITIRKQERSSTTESILEFDENGEEGKRLADLPLDMFEQVSKYLVACDYLNFRAASKIFRSIAPPISWRRALSAGSGSYSFASPLLMFADRDQSVYKFVDPNINNSMYNYYLMRIPDSLQNPTTICYSNLGWLLLLEPRRAVHLYNPFTRDIISYPHCRYGVGVEESTFFYSKPSASTAAAGDCPIISVGFFDEEKIMLKVIDFPGDVSDFDLDSERLFNTPAVTCPILFQDDYYYLDREGRLGQLCIDFSESEVGWEILDKPRSPDGLIGDLSYQNYLVECGGELISVFVGHVGKWVSVYKLNSKEWAWETVTDLGGYDLYLSSSSSFSALTTTTTTRGRGGNRIYLPWLRGSEIAFFSLDTGKWHFSGSKDFSCDLYGIRMHTNSSWIKPTW